MKKLNNALTALAIAVLCGWVMLQPRLAYADNTAGNSVSRSTTVAAQDAGAKAQVFTGQITQANGQYVLTAGDLTYSLDNQNKAKEFDGKQVKVTGTLDATTNTIRVEKIEALPS